jgi:hypothetical protein
MHFLARFFAVCLTVVLAAGTASANPETRIIASAPPAVNVVSSASVHVIANDRGGSVVSYAQEVRRLRNQDKLVVFNGQCASACTMFLSLNSDRTCIAPGASFIFHRAYGASADMNAWGTDFMIRQYPAWVRDWIARNGGLTDRLIRMDYAYASRYMRPCRVTSA